LKILTLCCNCSVKLILALVLLLLCFDLSNGIQAISKVLIPVTLILHLPVVQELSRMYPTPPSAETNKSPETMTDVSHDVIMMDQQPSVKMEVYPMPTAEELFKVCMKKNSFKRLIFSALEHCFGQMVKHLPIAVSVLSICGCNTDKGVKNMWVNVRIYSVKTVRNNLVWERLLYRKIQPQFIGVD